MAAKINSPEHMAWIGFTSSTSDLHANHDLISWSIKELAPKPEDLAVDSVIVMEKGTLQVKNRKLTISVWDNNTVDGDVISLKLGEDWILTQYELKAKKNILETTLIGFSEDLILYAHNVGMVPPNTVAITVFDGLTTQKISLESNMESSESIKIAYTGDEEN